MEKHAQDTYLREVRQHARYVKLAKTQLDEALRQRSSGVDDGVFMALQTLLSSAAMLSKLFWPGRGGLASRGPHLRDLLGISDDSPLRNRDLRNDFEHYDERIDVYAASGRRAHIDRNVGPVSMFGKVPPELINRHYDPEAESLSFRGAEIVIGPLVGECARLVGAAHALLPEGQMVE